MSQAREQARRIIHDLELTHPDLVHHLEEICVERGAYVQTAELEGTESALVTRGGRGVITVSASLPRANPRTRFSIAHELGHFELHRHESEADLLKRAQPHACRASEGIAEPAPEVGAGLDQKLRQVSQWEKEANEFAAELLMPAQWFAEDMRSYGRGFSAIERLAARYQTSLVATAQRYIELTFEPMALIWFDMQATGRSTLSAPWIARTARLDGGGDALYAGPLPPSSAACRACDRPDAPCVSDGPAAIWLRGAPDGWRVHEEARYFTPWGKGMAFVTLLP